jgi:hypothetical protein
LADDPPTASRVSESEMTALIGDYAKHQHPCDRGDVAFAKVYSSAEGEVFRRTMAAINARHPFAYLSGAPLNKVETMPTAPSQVGGDGDLAKAAYRDLMQQAEKAHRAGRYRTVEQAFAAVAADTQNAQKLADAVLRSRARSTSSYPG